MSADDQTIEDAAEAIRALNRRLAERDGPDYKASPEDQARAVFSVLQDAVVEHATLYTLKLGTVDREEAHYAAAGGFRLSMHRGEWMERGRPASIWITIQEPLSGP